MCGIIGYIGKKKEALPVLLNGLKSLEYRGYDSAGVAYLNKGKLEIVKSVGQIANLENKLDFSIDSGIGIGHTRWATHGIPNEVNSHPHRSGKLTIVHNGIIENYIELKESLIKKGYEFVSSTDTEVAACLLDDLKKETGDLTQAIEKFKSIVKGSYAIVIIDEENMDKLYVIKNMSPLIIGIDKDANYIASDVPAIVKYTNKYILLEDGEHAVVEKNKITLYSKDNKIKDIEIMIFNGDASSLEKGTYEHFMLKEIHEEPDVLRHIIDAYVKNGLKGLPDLSEYKSITIVACGSAMHAGLIGKHMIEKNLNIPVNVEIASEFKYKKLFLGKGDVIIAISQSGETADTLAAVKIAKSKGAHTIGIVNVKESSIAREVDEVIYTLAGSEIAVATTKAYIAQVAVLTLLSLIKNDISSILNACPSLSEELISKIDTYKDIAHEIKDCNDIFFIGRQVDYAICMEGSLKLKEISYIHSEAYAAGELKHGTISLIDKGTPVFAIITDKNIAEKTISNIKEVKARGAKVILIISEENNIDGDFYDEKIVIPDDGDFTPLLSVIPLQMISYYVALERGCSIDKPRNLAKSVTVE